MNHGGQPPAAGQRIASKAVKALLRYRRLSPGALLTTSSLLLLAAVLVEAEPKWLISPDAREPWRVALDRVERTREPIMAFVCIENQQLTIMMETETFGQIDVDKAIRDFLCVRVNALDVRNRPFLDSYQVGRLDLDVNVADVEHRGEVQAQGRAHTYPVTLFINPDGQLEHVVYGFATPGDFHQVLERVQQVMQVHDELRAKADDAKALARLGGLYVELQRYPAGREVLEKALALDQDGKLGTGETALLDLAITYMAAEENSKALEAISRHMDTYPESELRCKAHFLLGGAQLASVEPDRVTVEELTAKGDAEGAAKARERLLEGRRRAEEAWSWFESAKGDAPCAKTEWSDYSLGALAGLRAEMAYEPIAQEVDQLVAENKIEAAVTKLREFGADKTYQGTDRACEALFHAGEILLKAGKRAEALAQWRKLTSDDPKENPCAHTLWRGQAMGAIQENEKP